MTAEVLHLPVKPRRRKEGIIYFCTRCDSDIFLLHESGFVYCANCSSEMRNLEVGQRDAGGSVA